MQSHWLNFLHQQGLNPDSQGHYEIESSSSFDATQASLCIPAQSGFLSITGKDALRFMQGQFTCDLNEINQQQFRLGACCTPKGRMLASFTLSALASSEPEYLLSMHQPLVEKLQQHLSKYAVFFKAEMQDRSESWINLGIVGQQALTIAKDVFNLDIEPPLGCIPLANTPMAEQSNNLQGQLLVHDASRISLHLPVEEAITLWPRLIQHFPLGSSRLWPLACHYSGVGHVEAETSELFIPQMLNLQATGGISFSKGCYTGQEIIARMQFRGTLKRGMYRALLADSSAPQVGSPVYVSNKESPAGHIVSAVQQGNHSYLLLVLENNKTDQDIHLQHNQHKIELLPLPYTLDQ